MSAVKLLSRERQLEVFAALKEGDVLEAGQFAGFAPREKLVWRCEEVVEDEVGKRYTFHVYFHGVMLRAHVAYTRGMDIEWRRSS